MGRDYHTEDDDIIELIGPNGELEQFVEIAGIALRGNFYAILQPVELLDGMQEDEALVFRVKRNKSGQSFEIELNERIIDDVFAEYNRLLDEAEGKVGKKGGKRKGKKPGILGLVIPPILAILFFALSNNLPVLFVPLGIAATVWFIVNLVRRFRK